MKTATMKVKCATSLIITFEPQGIVVHNFLTKNKFSCNVQCLDFLNELTEWQTLEVIYKTLAVHYNDESIKSIIASLLENNALIVQNSEVEILDTAYTKKWEWGAKAGFYHFSVRNIAFLSGPQQRAAIRKRRIEKPEPPAIKSNNQYKKINKLPEFNPDNHLFKTMSKRRSTRNFAKTDISLASLADCLYTAKGVTGWLQDDDFGRLPLTMTPSGGARNPYELYVYAHSVSGLDPGFYHYCGETHDLGLVSNQTISPSDILANQEWTDDATAIIFLTANFERSSWKYHLAPAYRVVLIEAGFIGQNIALSATHHGLSAIPTGAVNEKKIENYLQIEPITEAHILSLVIGKPMEKT